MGLLKSSQSTTIQYAGLPGISKNCLDAVRRYIQFGDQIERVKILSAGQTHCLLLELKSFETIAVKSGFSSGYTGEGPRTFADVLGLLDAHGADIDEYLVRPEFIERLDVSALTVKDVEFMESLRPVRPQRWHDYIYDVYGDSRQECRAWKGFPDVIPWAIIDRRLLDLAKRFFDDPDHCILTGFRRLEDIVRKRLGSNEHGTKLFSSAFNTEKSQLMWKDVEASEQVGRANLFVGGYMAFRNPRAHKEPETDHQALPEFLLLNALFILESQAIDRPEETAAGDKGGSRAN